MGTNEFASRFEDLRIWQESRRLAVEIYTHFRENRDFGFRDQIQRAAVSVMNNTAEGFERKTSGDFSRFLDISKGSSGEVRSMLYLASDIHYMDMQNSKRLICGYENLSKSIASLTRSIRNKL